jgi:hypothetical protein
VAYIGPVSGCHLSFSSLDDSSIGLRVHEDRSLFGHIETSLCGQLGVSNEYVAW